MPRPAALALTLVLALPVTGGALAGCGNSRTPAPALSAPARVGGFRTLGYPSAGVTLAAPAAWTAIHGRPPMLVVITSGTAVIALWRYPRQAPLPAGTAALQRARRALTAAVASRSPGVEVIGSRAVRLDGRPAIELQALERIHGLLRRVSSTHVFASGAEVVLEEYAPPSVFANLDGSVFTPVRRSLLINGS